MTHTNHPRNLLLLTIIWTLGLLASGWQPAERVTWWMEVLPCFVALSIMWPTRKTFPLTTLLCVLIAIHGLILMLGGAYTYAKVPLGFWMQDWFGFTRNNYDKIGHFAQGFIPAMVAREVLIRQFGLSHQKLVAFLCISICLAFSALYEIIEWWSAVAMGSGADAFLGTQGYAWDTQSDMLLALIGASTAMLLLTRWHDRQMQQLGGAHAPLPK